MLQSLLAQKQIVFNVFNESVQQIRPRAGDASVSSTSTRPKPPTLASIGRCTILDTSIVLDLL